MDKTIKKNIFIVLTVCFIAAVIIILHPQKPSFHFQRALGFQMLADNKILVTDGGGFKLRNNGSKIFIIDRKGAVLWKYEEVRFAHSAVKLANGNILIPDTNNQRLIEVNPQTNQLAWTSAAWNKNIGKLSDGTTLDYPNYVSELANGHFLLSSRFGNAVVETDRGGNIFWSYKKLIKQHAPVRLSSGNTLIADSEGNRIIEVDLKGKTVWQYTGLNWPRFAQRLENGNTLITDSSNDRILEVTPAGEIVFEYGKGILSMPYQAEELTSGNIMIADGQHGRLLEINRKKQIVWAYERKNLLTEWLLMPAFLTNGGAEELDKNNLPKHWEVCDLLAPAMGTWKIDTKVSASGKTSFSITAKDGPARNKMWGQFIRNLGPGRLEIKCKIRTRGVKEGAGLAVNFADGKGGLIGGVNSKTYSGDTEWTELVVLTPIPEKTMVINVALSLVGPGTAWWDDVEMTRK